MILEKVTKEEKNVVEMEISVPSDEFEKAVEGAYRKNVGKIAIPGFRKGKAPRKMIEKMYGKEKIQNAIWFAKDLKDRYSVLWMYFETRYAK